MLDDLERQIKVSEEQMAASTAALERFRGMQEQFADLVGRGEAADGKVVVEFTREGVQDVSIDPRAMKLTSDELGEAVKEALIAGIADMQDKARQAVADAGLDKVEPPDMAEVRAQLEKAQASFSDAMRGASAKIEEAQRIRRETFTETPPRP